MIRTIFLCLLCFILGILIIASKMLRILYRIIWTLFYFLFSFIYFLKLMTVTLHKKCVDLFKIETFEDDLKLISKVVKQYDKTPSHLVIVLGSEDISYRVLGKVVVWCIAAGISFLSFYDYRGILQKKEAFLCKMISQIDEKYSVDIVWGKRNLLNGVRTPNGTKNGYENFHKMYVNIFSFIDGKGSIVNVAQDLCRRVQDNKLKPTDIDQDMVNGLIHVHTGVPDPDFAVICGPACCTYGLLPWQISITEFMQVQTHHNMTAEDFINILHKYSLCVQRYGK